MDVLVPRSLEEALALRADRPDAVAVAGGTDLMVEVNFGRARPPALLDLSRLEELCGWRRDDGTVFVGAGTTFAQIAAELREFRPLVEAARSVASPQIRNRATIGGNVCTASPAGDSLPVLAAYGASVVAASAGHGERRIPWQEFLLGPKQTALAADELVLGIEWRPLAGPGTFSKVGQRNAMVIAIAGVCLQLDPGGRTVRLALGSVGPTIIRAAEAEELGATLVPWDDPAAPVAAAELAEFGRLAAEAARPIDDLRGTAAYRRHAVAVLATRALGWALDDWRSGRC